MIKINGISSDSIGLMVETYPSYTVPEKEYEVTHVPGRNGDLVFDTGSYKNVTLKYNVAFGNEFTHDYYTYIQKIVSWLCPHSGYFRLEDSYDTDVYRKAYSKNSYEFANILMQAGRSTLEFDAKPQRYLKTGETPIGFAVNGIIRNPTMFSSLPLINVDCVGSGTLNIGGYSMVLTGIEQGVTIDSEIMDAYHITQNLNNKVSFNRGFPKLDPGYSEISFTGDIRSVEVIPRWWTI